MKAGQVEFRCPTCGKLALRVTSAGDGRIRISGGRLRVASSDRTTPKGKGFRTEQPNPSELPDPRCTSDGLPPVLVVWNRCRPSNEAFGVEWSDLATMLDASSSTSPLVVTEGSPHNV